MRMHMPVHACKVVFFHLEMKAGSSWFCGYPYLQNWTVLARDMIKKVERVKVPPPRKWKVEFDFHK